MSRKMNINRIWKCNWSVSSWYFMWSKWW